MTHVQLEEPWALGVAAVGTVILMHGVALVALGRAFVVRLGDLFDRLRRRGGEAVLTEVLCQHAPCDVSRLGGDIRACLVLRRRVRG